MSAAKAKPFRTILDPVPEMYSVSGDKEEDVIAMKLDDNGVEQFYVAGKRNIFDMIQAEAEGTSIEDIITKVMTTGDTSILQKVQGTYMDLTELPKDIFEAQQKIQEAQTDFEKMPLDIRKAYNNNFNEYLKDFGSEKWLEVMGIKKTEPDIKTEPTEKGEEQ